MWVAEHLALGTQVAVKLIDPSLARKKEMRDRFRQEATAAAQLRSAHVVQILDHGIDGDQPFIVMELLEGEDLFERLHHRGRLTLYETSKIVTQVARALTRAHAAGIVHRDLKPENVFLVLNDDGDDEVVKVLDFGVAKIATSTEPKGQRQRTELGELLGTPHYMSPEQIKGLAEIDHRTDLWALGVITYQCVIGELPFDSEGMGDLMIKIAIAEPPVPSQVMPDLTPAFDAWFEKACAREAADRHQSARAMADALARAVGISPEALRGPPSAPRSGWESDGPGLRAASTPRAQPAQPIVLVSELPPDSPKPVSSGADATTEKSVATPGDSEHPLSLPPVPVLLMRKRPDHGPDSKAGPDSKGAVAQSAPSAEPQPRPSIVLVQATDPEPPRDAPVRAASSDENPAPEGASGRFSPPPRSSSETPIDPWRARVGTGTTAGLTASTAEPPPSELDGPRRQRAGRWLALALLAFGLVVAGFVIRSRLVVGNDPSPQTTGGTTWTATAPMSTVPSSTSASAAPAVSAPPVVIDTQDAGGRAIEPGARAERDGGRPAPGPLPKAASSGKLGSRPVAPKRPGRGAGDDIFIEVPDAPDESAPPRSRSAVPLE